MVISTDITHADPHLGPLQDNGGPTYTQALLSGSPAINAGNPAGCSGKAGILTADQRGSPRVGRCDIGAYEIQFAVVKSVKRVDPNPTSVNIINFALTFTEAVTGIGTISPFSDFYLTTTGITGASVIGVSGSGDIYTVTVDTGSGTGTLRLDVVDNNTIFDLSSQPLGGLGIGDGNFDTGEVYTMDKTAPTVLSSLRNDPNPTKAASNVHFTVTFSEPVSSVDVADFTLSTTGSISGALVNEVSGSGNTYTVTVYSGNGVGTFRLDVPTSATITDLVGNPLASLPYLGGAPYTLSYYVYLPNLSKPDPATIVDVYTFSNRCADFTIPYNGHDAVRITQCITRVRIRLDGQMYFDMNWSAQFLTNDFNYIYKNSDANNPNMYITDNLGNRYDHVATGGAAAQITYFYRFGGPSSADGWFLFPAARSGANVFTFHDDDEQLLIDNIALIH